MIAPFFFGFWPVFAHGHRRPHGTRQATNRVDRTIKMTIDEFAEQVRDLQAAFGEYFAICDR